MIIVIDGYNVLRAAFPGPYTSSKQREQFIKQLAKYAQQKGHKILVVFDGGPHEWSNQEREYGIYVIYSGYRESADDYIKRYLKKNRSKDILLVSSDREIRDAAKRLDIESMGGFSFYNFLQDQVKGQQQSQKQVSGQTVKIAEEEHPELDNLMVKEVDKVHTKKEDLLPEQQVERKSSGQKLSKKERQRQKKIKKL